MARYRSRPVDVEAFRWDGGPVEGFERVTAGVDQLGCLIYSLVVRPFSPRTEFAAEGDWVVTGLDGDHAVKAEDFEALYEPRD